MNKFKFGGIDKEGIYIDENAMRMCYSHRRIFSQLVGQLIREGKNDKAKKGLASAEKIDSCLYNAPSTGRTVPYKWQKHTINWAKRKKPSRVINSFGRLFCSIGCGCY